MSSGTELDILSPVLSHPIQEIHGNRMQSMKYENLLKMDPNLEIKPSVGEGRIRNMVSRTFSPIADIIDGELEVEARNEDPRSPAHLIFRNDPHV
jgi:hypothetical protein